MITFNDIIKFVDYRCIKLIENGCFTYVYNNKKYYIRGDNVEKYISPIFTKLFQPNFVLDLFYIIQNRDNDCESNPMSKDNFLKAISKLHELGIIEILHSEDLLLNNKTTYSNLKTFNVNDDKIFNKLKSKNIVIINFIDAYHIKLLMNQIVDWPFNKINLINFYTNKEYKECNFNYNVDNLNIIHEHIDNLRDIKQHLNSTDLVITIHSAQNVELNSFINRYIIKFGIPWLNCIVNDLTIEIGPFVVPNKTACYDCYKYMNNIQGQWDATNRAEMDMLLITYRNFRISNLYIAFGYILDEIVKFLCYEDICCLPITINNMILINGLELVHSTKRILRVPNCRSCT